jgi:hypothetical protein
LRIAAAITAIAKEAQHAARKLRIVALQNVVPTPWSFNPAATSSGCYIATRTDSKRAVFLKLLYRL